MAGGIDAAQPGSLTNAAVRESADVDIGSAEIARIGDVGVEAQRRAD